MAQRFLMLACVSFLLFCSAARAGGPPWLSLPVEGVVSDKVEATAKVLTSKLKSKVWQHSETRRVVQLQQRGKQWYVVFYMSEDVRLHELETALASTGLTIPRDRLHLFGHCILEIETPKASAKALVSELGKLKFVAVENSQANEEQHRLAVTIDMPYPAEFARPDAKPVVWTKFQRGDLSSVKSGGDAAPESLPSYQALRDLVTKHQATLKDVRWSVEYACRPLGGVTGAEPIRTAGLR